MHVVLPRSAVNALSGNDSFLALLFVEIEQCEEKTLWVDDKPLLYHFPSITSCKPYQIEFHYGQDSVHHNVDGWFLW